MKQITAIHVDDDSASLEIFSNLVDDIPELSLIKNFLNPEEAFEYLRTNVVDVLFSDIEMPNKNGFWLTKQPLDPKMDIVFVTSHTDYALNAFEVCALDYLLKPVQINRLKRLIERIQTKVVNNQMQTQIKEVFNNYIDSNSYPKRIFVQTVGLLHMVMLDEVVYFSASGAYTAVHFKSGEELLSSKMIKTFVDALINNTDFVRTHRSFLVNKQYVKTIDNSTGKFTLTMCNGDQLEGSQRRKEEIIKQLIS